MKNRNITRLFVLVLAMVMMLFVVACNNTKPVETTPEQTTPEPTTPPHTHTEEILPAVAATCTEAGLTEGKKCSDCGETIVVQETIAALGHTEEVVAGKAATCTEAGLSDGKKCSVCGETTVAQEEIAATGHTYVDGACSACGEEEPLPLSNPIRINAETATEDRSADLGYKWDKDTATLTLCGMALHFDKGVGILINGIDVTVVIEGENTMVVTNYADGDTGCYGFNTTNALTFEGTGTLNMTVGDFTADLVDTGAAAYGIFAKPSTITWNSGTLNLVCGTIDGNDATLRNIQGMRAVDVVINGGEINIDTGLCFTTSKGAFLDGIYVTGSYTQNDGDVSISIGECIQIGTSNWIENLCICSDGTISILGGTFEAQAANTSGFPSAGSAIAGKTITFAHGDILAGADANGTDTEYTNQLYLKFVRTIALSNPIRIDAETASEDRSADLGYKWDKDTATLTLCGMELHFDKGVGFKIDGIDVTVVIEGKNTMIVTNYMDGDTGCYGFNTTNALTFEGTGTLNMTVGDFTADLVDTGAAAYGIFAKPSTITWNSGTLNLVCGTIDGNDATLRNIQGMRAVDVVINGGEVNIDTGLCFTTSKGAFLDGIYVTGSYTQNAGNVSISIGECIQIGSSNWIENLCICSDGTISILGGTFEAQAANTSGFPKRGSAIAGTITFGEGTIVAGENATGTDAEYTDQLYLKFVANA